MYSENYQRLMFRDMRPAHSFSKAREYAPWRSNGASKANDLSQRHGENRRLVDENSKLRSCLNDTESRLKACEEFYSKAYERDRQEIDEWTRKERARLDERLNQAENHWRKKEQYLIQTHKDESRKTMNKWFREKAALQDTRERDQKISVLQAQLNSVHAAKRVANTQLEYFQSRQEHENELQKKYDQLNAALELKDASINSLEIRSDCLKTGLADLLLLLEDNPQAQAWWDAQPPESDKQAILDHVFPNVSQAAMKTEIYKFAMSRDAAMQVKPKINTQVFKFRFAKSWKICDFFYFSTIFLWFCVNLTMY